MKLTYILEKGKRHEGYSPTDGSKSLHDSPSAGFDSTIASLETQLHEKNTQLQQTQALLLQQGRRTGVSNLDDRQVHERFSRLCKAINDWVVTHFKNIRSDISPGPDVMPLLSDSQPNYVMLLQNPRTKYLVLGGLVADVIVQAFDTGELLGSPAFSELKQAIEAKGREAHNL